MIILIIFISCSNIDLLVRGYYEVSFEFDNNIEKVYIDNMEIIENKKYYLNRAYHTAEIILKSSSIKKVELFLVDKVGIYFISENNIYLINKKYQIIE
ncbi:hypothetical protein EV215_1670 [Hypnocyclicus thermotrophus]|uniref:Uncharacterized protein n=1 Tax=Hypnocyclicus thermotrophus TaxID=1627895 RepID=A0AA46I551_9FUSO|nr:hypothetical protein [Hypnocyclicus thermotrophus]TDT68603.1 hypothetical protein EV215_1670 [Hypnocyclicus thermotrophus]